MQSDFCSRLRNRSLSHAPYFIYGIALLLTSCGYHFQDETSNLPPEIHSVAISIFANRTEQIGIESEITLALIHKFISAKRLSVTGQNLADALLTGTVKSFDTSPVTVTSTTQVATEYRATVTVEILLKRQRDGKIFFQEEIREWRNYPVVPDLAATENNKREAIHQIAVLLAERAHEWIMENF